jgi:8-amino-7-oxononanoate synthase
LGFSKHDELKRVMKNAIDAFGIGSTGSRRLSGNHEIYAQTESTIADFMGKPRGVLFNSGYQMNSQLFKALADESTLVVADKLIHASLIDGILSSTATFIRFQHNNITHCETILKKNAHRFSKIFIVCESVYSMDGDSPPIKELVRLKHAFGAKLIVDEAHSIGLIGEKGRGFVHHHGSINDTDIILLTFGKAMGLCGAMAICDDPTADTLKKSCRSYIYTTALPLPVAVTITHACTLLQESSPLRKKLNANITTFKSIISTRSSTYIQPIICSESSMDVESNLMSAGYYIKLIHPPTVQKSRLRISIAAWHEPHHIINLAQTLHTHGII